MIPSDFKYQKATSIDEALSFLDDESRILAGGHSLIPSLKLRFDEPGKLVDISTIEELRFIREADDHIAVGAATTHAEIASSNLLQTKLPVLASGAGQIGDLQVRNRGTIGGSLAHADPAADYPGITLACNASIVVKGTNGERIIPAAEFFQGLFMTALQDGELITEIRFPHGDYTGSVYMKFEQPASRYAIVGCAVCLKENKGKCEDITIGINGLTSHAIRADMVEKALKGNKLDDKHIDSAITHVTDNTDVSSDLFASSEYRAHLARVYVKKAIKAAMNE
jgi:carbon-monoxide dehydrogenase medium subunit